ncbi:hypothetical protein [Streptomyces stramineus]|uniref:hypothetical protein n=1 Tax=Streptomyces stramineus TaxID=173861 RepID=UPI0031D99C35
MRRRAPGNNSPTAPSHPSSLNRPRHQPYGLGNRRVPRRRALDAGFTTAPDSPSRLLRTRHQPGPTAPGHRHALRRRALGDGQPAIS